jgi:formylglycine-generating enzyme required for sulfatase activity
MCRIRRWDEAKEFCKRYTALMENGIKYDLPLEARTELVSRAGTSTRFPFGDSEEELQQGAWYSANAGGTTHAVAELKPNALGLYDTQGNVWEWQRDWYTDDTSRLPETDPKGPSSGSNRVIRGGGWSNVSQSLRSAHRDYGVPGGRFGSLGFRLEGTPE